MKEKYLTQMIHEKQNLKYFYIFSLIYLATMITSLTVSARLLPVHIPLTTFTVLLTGGTWIIPLSFFIQDITTEVYGYEKSRKLIQISVCILTLYILYLKATTFFPYPKMENITDSYNIVFNALPQHLVALLASILIGNLFNDYILSKSKIYFHGRYLPLRLIASSAIGGLALQFVGTTIAWLGNLRFTDQIIPFIFFSYLYKLGFEIIATPLSVSICKWLKKAEGIDIYDINVNYNPFSFK